MNTPPMMSDDDNNYPINSTIQTKISQHDQISTSPFHSHNHSHNISMNTNNQFNISGHEVIKTTPKKAILNSNGPPNQRVKNKTPRRRSDRTRSNLHNRHNHNQNHSKNHSKTNNPNVFTFTDSSPLTSTTDEDLEDSRDFENQRLQILEQQTNTEKLIVETLKNKLFNSESEIQKRDIYIKKLTKELQNANQSIFHIKENIRKANSYRSEYREKFGGSNSNSRSGTAPSTARSQSTISPRDRRYKHNSSAAAISGHYSDTAGTTQTQNNNRPNTRVIVTPRGTERLQSSSQPASPAPKSSPKNSPRINLRNNDRIDSACFLGSNSESVEDLQSRVRRQDDLLNLLKSKLGVTDEVSTKSF